MSRFGDGLAQDADLVAAAEVAAGRALAPLGGMQPDLATVFVSGGDAPAVTAALERASQVVGAGTTIGCSAPGVIGEGRGVEAASAVAVWCGVLPGVRARSFSLEVMPSDGRMAVVGWPYQEEGDVVGVLLADPWSFPVDGFVEQTNASLPGLPLLGGLAAGPAGRGTTRLLVDGSVRHRGAVGVLLGGSLDAGTVVSQGCRPIGPAMTVTAAEGNVLRELAGTPVLRKLEEVLNGLSAEEQALVSQGLQVGIARDEYVEEHGQGDFLIRGVGGIDHTGGGLVVGDIVPVGRTVRFQVRDAAAADHDLAAALQRFRDTTSMDTVEGALLFSCNGRGAALFGSADHDPQAVCRGLGSRGVAGCFAAGEIGPVGGRNFVHGFTASILAFGSGSPGRRDRVAETARG